MGVASRVEDRFARDLADLLTEEGFDVLDECNIDLSACRAKHGRALTGRMPRRFRHFVPNRSNDHNSVRGGSKDPRGNVGLLELN